MKKILVFVFGFLVVGLVGVALFNQPGLTKVNATEEVVSCAEEPSTFEVDTVMSVTNDPDSGFHGNWATDNFSRHIKIWKVRNGVHCATATDEGTFITTGPNSPQNGNPLVAGISGSMTGGTKLLIKGIFDSEAGEIEDLDCNFQECSATSKWVKHYFPGEHAKYDYLKWGWTYKACGHGEWVNADSGSHGDIVSEQTEEVCTTPTPAPHVDNGGGPTFAGSSTLPPVCSDKNTLQLPANPHVIRKGSDATVNFFITEGNSANIYWRVVGQSNWQNAVADVKPNADKFVSYTIHDLDPMLGYDFGIQQKQGCGGGQLVTAVIVDGPEDNVFRLSYWTW